MDGTPWPVVGKTAAIYDTGTTQIVGDPASIESFYEPLILFYGAESAPQYGDGIYTSTSASLVLLLIRPQYFLSITVPCDFNTPISMYVGENSLKEIKISPETFNLGPVEPGSDVCYGGAASDDSLTGGKLASDNLHWDRDKADPVQNFGLLATFSYGTHTLLGMSATRALVLLTFADLGPFAFSQ